MNSRAINTIYLMGIGGIAMGTLAGMLKEKGYSVVGSDQNLYPPMSTRLDALDIPVCQGYQAENIQKHSPDVVIVGNVIRRDNPEAQFVLEQKIPYMSMPEAIAHFFLNQHKSMVVAGTHGKSTTSSLLTRVLAHGGYDPSAFIGAFIKDWQSSYRLGSGQYMVLEGDEYDTAFFDKGPKFLHYRPSVGIITSIEYDHADIFPNFEAVLNAFRLFVGLIPQDGFLIVNADDPHCFSIAGECKGKVITYGENNQSDYRLMDVDFRRGEVRFVYQDPFLQKNVMVSKLPGKHNVSNTLAVIAAAAIAGLPNQQIQEALNRFQGVQRRQDIVGESNGVLIVDDFAHHPTAVRETIHALRRYYPDRRFIAAFEPRTNSSRRRIFQTDYVSAFDEADCICIKSPPDMEKIPCDERLDARQLVHEVCQNGGNGHFFQTTEELTTFLVDCCRAGDLVLCMSNGSFDGLPQKLLAALHKR